MPSINDHVIIICNQIAHHRVAAFLQLSLPEIYRGLTPHTLSHSPAWMGKKENILNSDTVGIIFKGKKTPLAFFSSSSLLLPYSPHPFFFNTSTHNELYQTYQQASSSCPCFFPVDSSCSVSCPEPRSNPGTHMRARWCSQYSSLKYAVPTICESPSSLYSFTEEELMFKDTGKFPKCDSPHLMLVCYV